MENFKQKYIKYKTKYIHQKRQNMENQMDDTTTADDSPVRQITESYDSSVLDDSTEYTNEYTTSSNDSNEFPRNIPIGFAKNIMVILDKDSDYHKDFVSVFQKKISKDSILSIKTIEEFDEISKRYGKLGNKKISFPVGRAPQATSMSLECDAPSSAIQSVFDAGGYWSGS